MLEGSRQTICRGGGRVDWFIAFRLRIVVITKIEDIRSKGFPWHNPHSITLHIQECFCFIRVYLIFFLMFYFCIAF
jgi:hypothetical protein